MTHTCRVLAEQLCRRRFYLGRVKLACFEAISRNTKVNHLRYGHALLILLRSDGTPVPSPLRRQGTRQDRRSENLWQKSSSLRAAG